MGYELVRTSTFIPPLCTDPPSPALSFPCLVPLPHHPFVPPSPSLPLSPSLLTPSSSYFILLRTTMSTSQLSHPRFVRAVLSYSPTQVPRTPPPTLAPSPSHSQVRGQTNTIAFAIYEYTSTTSTLRLPPPLPSPSPSALPRHQVPPHEHWAPPPHHRHPRSQCYSKGAGRRRGRGRLVQRRG